MDLSDNFQKKNDDWYKFKYKIIDCKVKYTEAKKNVEFDFFCYHFQSACVSYGM
jgi:hypothetical protein